MNDPIRVLHFADLHIGMENYGRLDPTTGTSSRVLDYLDRLDEVIDYAIQNEADLVVFAGDAFKTRDPKPTHLREFARRIKRLANNKIITLLLVGNHDMPGMTAKANSLDIFEALEVSGVIVGHNTAGLVVKTRRGPVFLAWVPYPMRSRLLAPEESRGKSIDELQTAVQEKMSMQILDLARHADDKDMPRILVGHFSVAGATLGSERSIMLGHDTAIEQNALSRAIWDYVALGHIHQHQVVKPEDPPIIYSGSLERIDFGEENEAKGFCWIKLERGMADWEFIPVNARAFHTVSVDVRPAKDPTVAVLGAIGALPTIEGAIVRIQIQMTADQVALLRERDIEQALEPAYHSTIAREIEAETRLRSHSLSPSTMSPRELVEQYFKSRDVKEDRLTVLMTRADELLTIEGESR